MKCYIYSFTNILNNKKYIGSTIKTPKQRYNEHIYNCFHENTHQYNYPLYQAIRKYGLENFIFETLLEKDCDEQEIREIEKNYILKLNTISPNGYNQTDETKHPINTIEAYAKMKNTKREKAKRVALVDNNYKIIQIWRSIVDCAENLHIGERHIAACCRGERHTVDNKIFLWLNNDNELIIPKFIGVQYKGKKGTTQHQITNKRVIKYDIITNEMLQIYDSIALAARENNCDASAIIKVCKGKRKKCGGYGWKYEK